MEHRFTAILDIIGINPFVSVPEAVLEKIFAAAGRASGPIPIKGTINGNSYQQTLVRYKGEWRLYVNMLMLPDSPRRIGESVQISVAYDPVVRSIPVPAALDAALQQDLRAKAIFDALRPSLRKEIVRYIAGLKSEDSITRNVQRALDFLHGRARFIGRDTIHD